jgi:adenine-specific DNA-methyltransferase
VGAAVDHDRHVTGRAGARPSAVDGGEVPLLPARRHAEGQQRRRPSLTGTPPVDRDPTSGDIRRGFVYERVQHITLKSIANNPDIVEGMSREEIDAAIKRHADFELLYDKPYEDKKKVRVTGPFTVESLSPHRSLAFAGEPDDARPAEDRAGRRPGRLGADVRAMILENLAKAGIQNGRRNERLSSPPSSRTPATTSRPSASARRRRR